MAALPFQAHVNYGTWSIEFDMYVLDLRLHDFFLYKIVNLFKLLRHLNSTADGFDNHQISGGNLNTLNGGSWNGSYNPGVSWNGSYNPGLSGGSVLETR